MTKLYRAETKEMDLLKMLADLRQEREHIEEAIVTLERLARGRGRRRGRPPAWMPTIKRRGRPPGSKNKPKESAAALNGGHPCRRTPAAAAPTARQTLQ